MMNSKLSQTINLLTYLYSQSTYVKADTLAEMFSLSNRSIRRLIRELKDLGFNIKSVRGPYGGYKLDRNNIILPVKISENDRQTFLAIKNTVEGSNLPNKEESLRLLDIIGLQSQLSSEISTQVFQTKKLLKSKKAKIDSIYNTLSTAIDQRLRVEVKYQSLSSPQITVEWKEFRPEAFQVFNGVSYIKGYYSEDLSKLRVLRLSRFIAIKLSHKKYSFNESFENDNKLAFSRSIFQVRQVKLKIFSGLHDILDYEYGKKQKLEQVDDHFILTFDMSGDLLIKELVLSMGVYCELLEPENLRKEIIDELAKMSSHYK